MFDFVTIALAVFAVSSLLVEFDGPYYLFARFREFTNFKALTCVVCTSVYVSILFYLLNHYGIDQHILPLATIGAIILIERIKWS